MNPNNAILALLAELQTNLMVARQEIADLKASLAAATPTPPDEQ